MCSFFPKNKSRKEHRRRRRRWRSSTNSNSLDWCVHYKNISHRLQRKTVIIHLILIYIKIYKFFCVLIVRTTARWKLKSALNHHACPLTMIVLFSLLLSIFSSGFSIVAFFDNHIAREIIAVVAQKMFDELSAMVQLLL